jgi:hypothetical protein
MFLGRMWQIGVDEYAVTYLVNDILQSQPQGTSPVVLGRVTSEECQKLQFSRIRQHLHIRSLGGFAQIAQYGRTWQC